MNSELIEKIEHYKLNENSNKSTIRSFLNTCISANLYSNIEGGTMEDKIEIVYDYLQNIIKEPEVKQLLNIVIADDASSLDYVSYLNEKFEVIVHKIIDVKNPKDIDLVLFTGGEDVNPGYYNESVGKYTFINNNRDKKEIDTFAKFRGNSFLLGICRGSQLLTVLSGGKLIQHVEGHCKDHSMMLRGSLSYNITSSHHQMLYPFNLNEKDYELIAYSEFFQSKTYLNGNNEEIELTKNFLEPEIVYYKNTNSLCIQGHPEWSHCERRTSSMCLNLIDRYLQEFKKSKEGNTSTSSYNTSNPFSKTSYNSNYFDENDLQQEDHYEEDHNEEDMYSWEIAGGEPEETPL